MTSDPMVPAPDDRVPQPDELPAPPTWRDVTKLPLLMIALMFIAGAVLYPSIPARFASHWGIAGTPDAYSTKSFLSVFLLPLIAAAVYALLVVAPLLDPKRRSLKMSIHAYNIVVDGVIALEAVVFAATLAAAFNAAFDVTKVILVGVGLLFAVIGNFMTTVKQNWTFGVRVSWTLSDEVVWRKTNRLGGYLFVATGVLTMFSALLPAPVALATMLSAIAAMLVITYVYAYLLYRSRHPES